MTHAGTFLGSFGRALATMTLYSEGHPAIEHAIDQAWHDLERLLAAAPHAVFTFVDDTVLVGDMPVADLREWEWSERLSRAGIQRIELDAALTRGDLSTFLSDLRGRLTSPGQQPPASQVARGLRYGAIGLRGEAPAAQAPLATATLALSLDDEFQAARWLEEEVRASHPIPLVEAETIVRSLSVAMHAGREIMLPLVALKHFDQYSTTHSLNVSLLVMGLAERLGLASGDVHDYGVAALLHDIGKTVVPLEVLNKASQHTSAEQEIMKRHPADGARLILRADDALDLAAVVAYEHHIMQNGGGYPSLRFPRACHPASRLARICDVFDALSTRRPYRDAWPLEEVIALLRTRAGVDFDPDLVEPFVTMILETANAASTN